MLQTSGTPLLPCTCPRVAGSSVGAINGVSIPAMHLSPSYRSSFHGLSGPAVKGYQPALNLVFSLTGMAVAAGTLVSWMFRCFERSCPPRELRPLDWNLSLVLSCLSRLPFEPLKLASDNHLTWKTSFS